MASVQVTFIDRVVRVKSDRVGVRLYRSPEVRDKTVRVVHRLNSAHLRAKKQRRAAPKKRLDVVVNVRADGLPHFVGNRRLAAKPRKQRTIFQRNSLGRVMGF